MYHICTCEGSGATAVVQVAKCLANGKNVAIKRIDLDTCGASIEELQVGLVLHCNRDCVCCVFECV